METTGIGHQSQERGCISDAVDFPGVERNSIILEPVDSSSWKTMDGCWWRSKTVFCGSEVPRSMRVQRDLEVAISLEVEWDWGTYPAAAFAWQAPCFYSEYMFIWGVLEGLMRITKGLAKVWCYQVPSPALVSDSLVPGISTKITL